MLHHQSTKRFDENAQKQNQQRLAHFIEICVQNSQNADWIQSMLDECLCILCENNETALLVANTMVDIYIRIVLKRYDEQKDTAFWRALGHIRERIVKFIVELDNDSIAIDDILSEVFKRLNADPEVISCDSQGMGELIGKFFLVATLDMKLLSELIALEKKHTRANGDYAVQLLELCANQPAILNGLNRIIYDVKSVRTTRLALDLAVKIQRYVS